MTFKMFIVATGIALISASASAERRQVDPCKDQRTSDAAVAKFAESLRGQFARALAAKNIFVKQNELPEIGRYGNITRLASSNDTIDVTFHLENGAPVKTALFGITFT